MSLKLKRRTNAKQSKTDGHVISGTKRRGSGHSKPLPITVNLDQPGRLRIGHLMNLFAIGHTTLYSRVRAGVLPKPDGRDGKRPYWNTSTVRSYL